MSYIFFLINKMYTLRDYLHKLKLEIRGRLNLYSLCRRFFTYVTSSCLCIVVERLWKLNTITSVMK